MTRYWNDRQPFSYLRKRFGIQKPFALGWNEWDEWNSTTKANHPVGWFVTETLPDVFDWIDNHTFGYINSFNYYIRNRFYRQTHVLPTGLERGLYHDLDTRILHGLFTSLVDFVEVEKAWMNRWDKDRKQKYKMKRGRSAIGGLAYLQWEMSLVFDEEWMDKSDPRYGKPTEQAIQAQEVHRLYHWWKYERPARPDPYDASGWTAYCEACREENGGNWIFASENKTPKLKKMGEIARKKLRKIEEQYDKEDESNLMSLIKIRKGLWT
jgi:hypothetical protein